MVRSADDAIAWAKAHKNGPPAGFGASDGTWYRMCLQYVRGSFGLPGGTPDAGKAWDWAKKKHREKDGDKIPRGVPVFWETPSIADHVALSLGDGKCLSTDAVRRGKCDVVRIDDLTKKWGMELLGWTEDLNGFTVWKPAPPKKKTPNITAALKAEKRDERRKALNRVVKHGSKAAREAATAYLGAMDRIEVAEATIRAQRATLKKLEVK